MTLRCKIRGYIYLVQPKYYIHRSKWGNHTVRIPDNVYKVGQTEQIPLTKRLCKYGECKKIYVEIINNVKFLSPVMVETRCIEYFKENFEKWNWGREYFIISDIEQAKRLIKITYKEELEENEKLRKKLEKSREERRERKKEKQYHSKPWSCNICTFNNTFESDICFMCEATKEYSMSLKDKNSTSVNDVKKN